MEREPSIHRVGEATIIRIAELALDGADPAVLYPGSDPAAAQAGRRLSGPGSVDPQTGLLRQSVHAWLVRTQGQLILIDSGTGNGKDRPDMPIFDHLNEPFLERLQEAGAQPEDVDLVLHTHLHVDHVGWNTRKIDGRWSPTFPNAQTIFSGRERAYSAALAAADGSESALCAEAGLGTMLREPARGVYEDSILPVIEAGLAREIVIDGTEVVEGFRFLPSPGHSIDHASISFTSQGEQALFWGDVMHHPLQFAYPDWNSVYCEFPDAAVKSRRWAMAHAADTDALVFTTHFAESSAGRISRDGARFTWHFA